LEVTSLNMALRRINMIEQQFQSLMNNTQTQSVDGDFQQILNKKIESQKNADSKVSKTEINELITKYSNKNGLDENFVKAVINQESGFNPNAKSHCGAMGLMQLMPATAESLGVTDAYNAEQNIDGGTKYLKGLLDRYGNNKELALAAYNAGPNAVKKYGGIPPYAETQNYVKKVLSNYDNYKGVN